MSSESANFLNKNPNSLVLRKGLGMTLPESASLAIIKLRARISQNFLFNPTYRNKSLKVEGEEVIYLMDYIRRNNPSFEYASDFSITFSMSEGERDLLFNNREDELIASSLTPGILVDVELFCKMSIFMKQEKYSFKLRRIQLVHQ
jgi:hypothetical protein